MSDLEDYYAGTISVDDDDVTTIWLYGEDREIISSA